MSVLIETTIGNLVVDLHVDKCPVACFNFIKLCKIKYYNFSPFHKIEPGFTAQTGDSYQENGGSSIYGILYGMKKRLFEKEIHNELKFRKRGIFAMTSSSSTKTLTNGSQFFITLGNNLDYLDEKHTIFGELAEGFDTLDKLEDAQLDDTGRPFFDIRIKHTYVLDDPFKDPPNLEIPDKSPIPSKNLLLSMRVSDLDLDEDNDEDSDSEESERKRRKKESEAQSLTLEMLGDLPSAAIKPPENVLFVAKLNPITNDDDLELIFSRFGKVNSCEIIKDKKTGKSLQYAFIEFDEKESAEE